MKSAQRGTVVSNTLIGDVNVVDVLQVNSSKTGQQSAGNQFANSQLTLILCLIHYSHNSQHSIHENFIVKRGVTNFSV